MFSYFKGTVIKKLKDKIVLDVHDVGYEIYMTEGDILSLKEEDLVKINAYTDIKEGYVAIFGFLKEESQSVFEKLKKVSGVGSKSALQILSNINPSDICIAIANEDITLLKQVPGIGPKTAGRIILELKDKILKEIGTDANYTKGKSLKTSTEINEACLALKVLGYSTYQINETLAGINTEGLKVDEVIKKVLSNINKN